MPNTLATVMGSSAFNLQSNDIGWYISMLVGFDCAGHRPGVLVGERSGKLPKEVE